MPDNKIPNEDVPSPIDFHDFAQPRAWEEDTVRKRPWRPRFFDAYVAALNNRFRSPFTILELGSGSGHLAEQILAGGAVENYMALVFSEAMHQFANERLAAFGDRLEFIKRDFRASTWTKDLGKFDAIITLQAAHELRLTRHLVPFLTQVRQLMSCSGMFLYCDHYAEGESNPALMLKRERHLIALQEAGFGNVSMLRDEGSMALYSAENSS